MHLEIIKDSARPSYWVPDEEAPNCSVCKKQFGTAEELALIARSGQNCQSPHREIFQDRRRHHCRDCGQAVCNPCSLSRQPVPERGWNTDVRVCDTCTKLIK